jgi:hypothetical protein
VLDLTSLEDPEAAVSIKFTVHVVAFRIEVAVMQGGPPLGHGGCGLARECGGGGGTL